MVVFLNVFRDQLDRYGEVDSVIKKWGETLKKLPKNTKILVNGDDENTAKLESFFKGPVSQFGVKDYKILGEAITYKKEQSKLDFEAKDVKLKGLSGSKFSVVIQNQITPVNFPLPGIYHIYDFLASLALGHELGFTTNSMVKSLKTFQPAFGRMEKLPFGYIFLIKNPAGATQVFQTIAPQLKSNDRLFLALNDNLADGTDVSWIWDVNFDILQNSSRAESRDRIIVSGSRAYDLANRLKYAGFKAENIMIKTELKEALQEAKKGLEGTLYILPTYTALMELQKILTKSGLKKNYWESD